MKKLICILTLLLALVCVLAACDAARSITKSEIVNGELVITYSDGTSENLGKVVGDKGEKGEKGEKGAAATDDIPQGFEFFPLADGTYGVWLLKSVFLEEVVVPSTYQGKPVTQIVGQNDAMEFYATTLKKITIPNTITKIGDDAFSGLKSLETVVFEENSQLTSIGEDAFVGCWNLTSITIPNSVINIGEGAIRSSDKLTCTIYENGKYLGNVQNPYLYLAGVVDTSVTTFTMADTTKWIGTAAFANCSSLATITISEGVTSVGAAAFHGCSSLEAITIPNSVIHIGREAFAGTSSLLSVTFAETNGWIVTDGSAESARSATELADPAKAATYLKSTYRDYIWTRTEE